MHSGELRHGSNDFARAGLYAQKGPQLNDVIAEIQARLVASSLLLLLQPCRYRSGPLRSFMFILETFFALSDYGPRIPRRLYPSLDCARLHVCLTHT